MVVAMKRKAASYIPMVLYWISRMVLHIGLEAVKSEYTIPMSEIWTQNVVYR